MLELQLPACKHQIGDGIESCFFFSRGLRKDTVLQPGRSVPLERFGLQGWVYTIGWLKTAAPVVRGNY